MAPAPAASGLSLNVAAGQGALFPAAPFNCTVWPVGVQPLADNAEIIRVTSKGSGDDWTILRTQEGSSARAIVVGDQISATITKKTLTDIEEAVSVVSQALSVETAARVAGDDSLSNAVSVVSTAASHALSVATLAGGIAVSALGVANAASNAASVVSQAVSVVSQALSVETAARVAKDDLLSQAISVVSNAASAASALARNAVSIHDLLSNVVSNEISNRTSADAALSVRIDTQSQAISVLSQAHSALSQAHSVLSQALSNEISNRTSADNALSQAISVVSNQVSVVSSLVSNLTSAHNALSNQVSNLISAGGGGTSVTSNELSAAAALLSARVQSVLTVDISTLSQQLSVLSQAHSALSQAHSVLSNVVSNELSVRAASVQTASAAATSADAHAAAASAAATSVAAVASLAVSVVSHGLSVLSQANSAAHVSLANAISVVSNAVSIVSTAASAADAHAGTASAAATSVDGRVNSVNTFLGGLSVRTSLAGASVHGLQSILNAISQRISVEAPLGGGGGSVTSTEVSAVSAQAASAINVLSQAVSVISQQVSVLSATAHFASVQNVDASAVSAGAPVYAFTSADTFKRASAGHSAFLGLVADDAVAVSAVGRVQTGGVLTLTTAQWDAITGQIGGLTAGAIYHLDVDSGKLTTTSFALGSGTLRRNVGVALSSTKLLIQPEIGVDTASALSLLAAQVFINVSQQLSVLSQGLSALGSAVSVAQAALSVRIDTQSQAVSALTSAHNVLSNVVSGLPGGGSTPAGHFVTNSQIMSAVANISGLSVSVSAGGVYRLEAYVMFNAGTTSTPRRFGMTFPAMVNTRGRLYMQMSASPSGAGAISAVNEVAALWNGNSASNSNLISMVPPAPVSSIAMLSTLVTYDGMMQVSATGVVQLRAGSSAGLALTIVPGSYIRAIKIS